MQDYAPVELRAMFRAGHSQFWEVADKAGILPKMGVKLTYLEGTDDPREAVAQVRQSVRTVPAKKGTTRSYETSWRSAHRDGFPNLQPVAWTQKEHHMIRQIAKSPRIPFDLSQDEALALLEMAT